jgi:pseudouridine-5'-phosphate glycosidase
MDISADLTELGRTPVAVVCAGAKSVSNSMAAAQLCRSLHGFRFTQQGIPKEDHMLCKLHVFQSLSCCCCCPPQVLDIPRTLEYLETQGVCVAAYGAEEFPAFFSRHSGCKAPCRVDTPEQ